MKNLKLFLTILLLAILTVTSNAQVLEVNTVPCPEIVVEVVETDTMNKDQLLEITSLFGCIIKNTTYGSVYKEPQNKIIKIGDDIETRDERNKRKGKLSGAGEIVFCVIFGIMCLFMLVAALAMQADGKVKGNASSAKNYIEKLEKKREKRRKKSKTPFFKKLPIIFSKHFKKTSKEREDEKRKKKMLKR